MILYFCNIAAQIHIGNSFFCKLPWHWQISFYCTNLHPVSAVILSQEQTYGTLSFYEFRFSGRDTMRWWRHSNLVECKSNSSGHQHCVCGFDYLIGGWSVGSAWHHTSYLRIFTDLLSLPYNFLTKFLFLQIHKHHKIGCSIVFVPNTWDGPQVWSVYARNIDMAGGSFRVPISIQVNFPITSTHT